MSERASTNNHLAAELMIPRVPHIGVRAASFYLDIAWQYNFSEEDMYLTVSPVLSGVPQSDLPRIGYWQTDNARKLAWFHDIQDDSPTSYSRGFRIPRILDLVETTLLLPNDDDVWDVFSRGGRVLRAHTFIGPREHAGRQEFRFVDPFNYGLRVTSDPANM